MADQDPTPTADRPGPTALIPQTGALAARSAFGGALMGLANLVPGLSGGTMLLAAGVYPPFIRAVAEVSTFRFRPRSVLVLGCAVAAAFIAVVIGAGIVSDLVIHRRWIMYSLFIGLTLGGVPVLWRLIKPADATVIIASVVGIAIMALIAASPAGNAAATGTVGGYGMLVFAGIAGGAAMILPGISGGYLLLVLGQYVTILSAIDSARAAASAGDWAAAAESLHVVIPVGLGVLIGVVGVSNALKLLLAKFERATLGVLLGLLLGAVLGLWPFQQPVEPQIGDVIKGVELTTPEMVAAVEAEDWPTHLFTPTAGQVAISLVLIAIGFALAAGVAHIGRGAPDERDERAPE